MTNHFRATMAIEYRTFRDGQTYSYEECIAHYGEMDGETWWAEAGRADGPERADAGAEAAPADPAVDSGTLAVVPMAQAPHELRIGFDKNGYDYVDTGLSHEGFPLYRCRRGRDEAGTAKLFLAFVQGVWMVGEVRPPFPVVVDALVKNMTPVVQAEPGEDVLVVGRHQWACWDASRDRWEPAVEFVTSHL